MHGLMRAAVVVGGTLVALGALGYLGLQIQPRPFARYPGPTPPLQRVPLPAGLPAPVERFYRTTMGETVPLIESAIITGRARLRFAGIRFLARWRFTHQAGQNYRHYIEATVFGYPLMKVNEHYLDGHARLELPVGVVENEPKVDSAANLALWGEALFFPSLYLTDPRARWEAVDESHARLVVPHGAEGETFAVTFDPESGLIQQMEAMRWKDAQSTSRTRWILDALDWQRFHGMLIPATYAVTWGDESGPWLVATLEEVVYNAAVEEYIRAEGP